MNIPPIKVAENRGIILVKKIWEIHDRNKIINETINNELKFLRFADSVAGTAINKEPNENIDNLYPIIVSENSRSFMNRLNNNRNPVKLNPIKKPAIRYNFAFLENSFK